MKYSKVLLSLLAVSTLTAGYAAVDCDLGAKCYSPGQVAGEKRGGDGNGTLVFFKVTESGDYRCRLSIDDSQKVHQKAQATVDTDGGAHGVFKQTIETGTPVTFAVKVKLGQDGELKFRLIDDREYRPDVVAVRCALQKG